MTIRTVQHRVGRARTVKRTCEFPRTVKAILGDLECDLGRLAVAPPINVSLHVFHRIIDEHRAGKKSRI
jgi:hypothetical protein